MANEWEGAELLNYSNSFEAEARLKKAARLAAVIRESGIVRCQPARLEEALLGMHPSWWADIAEMAQTRIPSDKTIALVVRMVCAKARSAQEVCDV